MKTLVDGYFRSLFLGCFLGFTWMTVACGPTEPSEAGSLDSSVDPPDLLDESPLAIKGPPKEQREIGSSPPIPREPIECSEIFKPKPCKKYRIPLMGNVSDNDVRKKYKDKLKEACYIAAKDNSFNCYYKTPQDACEAVMLVPKAYGAVDYDNHPETCTNIPGTEIWSLQTGSNAASLSYIYYEDAPLQHPLILVDGVPTLEVNGPYRNLPEPSKVLPGKPFDCYFIDGVLQKERILQMNRKKNGGKIRSDLAGFTWPCKEEASGTCTEKEFLKEPSKEYDVDAAQVDHVASKKDPRGCDWGKNSNKNAAVISAKLNNYFSNKDRPKDVVDTINAIPPYSP